MISYGGVKRDGVAIEGQLPSSRVDGGNDLSATSAKAVMDRSCIRNRNVERPFGALVRDELDKLVADLEVLLHNLSSFVISLPPIA